MNRKPRKPVPVYESDRVTRLGEVSFNTTSVGASLKFGRRSARLSSLVPGDPTAPTFANPEAVRVWIVTED